MTDETFNLTSMQVRVLRLLTRFYFDECHCYGLSKSMGVAQIGVRKCCDALTKRGLTRLIPPWQEHDMIMFRLTDEGRRVSGILNQRARQWKAAMSEGAQNG